jgi:hypothetical protein
MVLQWSTPSAPEFPRPPANVTFSATKDLGDGTSVTMAGQIGIGVEGPTPTDEDVLGWLGLIHGALKADGWAMGLRFEETAVSRRFVEEIEEA